MGVHYQFDSHGFFGIDTEKLFNCHDPSYRSGNRRLSDVRIRRSPESSFPEILDDLLPGVSVINLGVSGYSSFQGYKTLLKYVPALNPALIIVGFNHNDRRYVISEDEQDSDVKFSRDAAGDLWEDVRTTLRLYRVMQALMSKAGLVKTPESVTAVEDVRKLNVRVPPGSYGNNFVNMAKFCKENIFPSFLCCSKRIQRNRRNTSDKASNSWKRHDMTWLYESCQSPSILVISAIQPWHGSTWRLPMKNRGTLRKRGRSCD